VVVADAQSLPTLDPAAGENLDARRLMIELEVQSVVLDRRKVLAFFVDLATLRIADGDRRAGPPQDVEKSDLFQF